MKKIIVYLCSLLLVAISCSPIKEKDIYAEVDNIDVRPYTLTDSTMVGDLFVYGLWGQVRLVKQSVFLEGEEQRYEEISFSPKGRVVLPNKFKKGSSRDKNTEKYTFTSYEEDFDGGTYKTVETIERAYDSNGFLLSVKHVIPGDCTVKLAYVYSPYPTKKITAINEEIENIENHSTEIKYALGIYPDVSAEGYYDGTTLHLPSIVNNKFKINSTDENGNWTNVSFVNNQGEEYVIKREISYYSSNDNKSQTENNNGSFIVGKTFSLQKQERNGEAFRHVYSFKSDGTGEWAFYRITIMGMSLQDSGTIKWTMTDENKLKLYDGEDYYYYEIKGNLFSTELVAGNGDIYTDR